MLSFKIRDFKFCFGNSGFNREFNLKSIWREFNVIKDSVGLNLTVKERLITRRIENSRDFLDFNADTIVDYIDFDHCVVDMLHLLWRISEVLFSSLILILKDLDSAISSFFFNFFLISINQIDLCHTSNISSKGWFIHLFEKEIK
jgi:hypothetical protein